MVKNVYVHIPFCRRKCHYCSFVSFEQLTLKNIYLDSLESEIKQDYKGEGLNTLYFGGGTPSVLSVGDFERLVELFKVDGSTEITAEINPEGIDRNYLEGLKRAGINRLSIGSQSFNDKILAQIGRKHSAAQIEFVVKTAKQVGFDNISLDLIYGLPSQSLEDFKSDLKKALALEPQHVSLYGLKIEEGCGFFNHKPDFLPDDDIQADMYLMAVEVLKQNRFEHYEISNFALEGFNSKHNLNYWDNNSYYGFGVSAHGYVDGVRYSNQIEIDKYIQNSIKKETQGKVSMKENLEEEIFLGLRKSSGLDISVINEKFGINFEEKYAGILKKYSTHFEKTPKGYALNLDGVLVSNAILSEFI